MRTEDLLREAFPEARPESPGGYFGEIADVFEALAFADLFWPECFEVHGAVFLRLGANSHEWVSERIGASLQRPSSERRSWHEIVDSFNWFEVPYLFRVLRDAQELRGEASRRLADILRRTWSARLAERYHDRVFEVVVVEPTDHEALSVAVRQNPHLEKSPPRFQAGSNGE